ncbi:unnamed protein product [Caenorhabditis nigoni]|uniref:SKP1 component POZ domain-containing protein n=1 Tax=Caenorhabditis nigoni TaxID=1611254 RepID=A0A2G5SXB6_9PELO|nr:hypothetical protein B9Z55_025175 [Caenorhabditis nigoni]
MTSQVWILLSEDGRCHAVSDMALRVSTELTKRVEQIGLLKGAKNALIVDNVSAECLLKVIQWSNTHTHASPDNQALLNSDEIKFFKGMNSRDICKLGLAAKALGNKSLENGCQKILLESNQSYYYFN